MTFQRRYLYLARDFRKMAVDLYSMQQPPDHEGLMSLSRTVVPNEVGLPRDRDGHGAGCGGVDFTKYPTSHWENNNTTQSLPL